MKNSQPCFSLICTEFSKAQKFFHVSIVNTFCVAQEGFSFGWFHIRNNVELNEKYSQYLNRNYKVDLESPDA